MKLEIIRRCGLGAFLVACLLTGKAAAQESMGWRLDSSLNLFMAGMSGDMTLKGIPASIDASFADVLENLEASAAGRVTLGYKRWFVSTEFSYLHLESSVPAARADLEQWLVEPTAGYGFCRNFTVFAGARYNNLDGEVTFNGPAGRASTGTQEWWDPILGGQFSTALLGDKLSLDGRFDVGGFGVGSDLTWQAFPYLNWRFGKSASLQVGYRWLGTDYEHGSGMSKFRYDVVVQGPQVGLTIHL